MQTNSHQSCYRNGSRSRVPSTILLVAAAAITVGWLAAPPVLSADAQIATHAATIMLTACAPQVIASVPWPVKGSGFAFGYVEFDWDPDAPGGVPGFGPLSASSDVASR